MTAQQVRCEARRAASVGAAQPQDPALQACPVCPAAVPSASSKTSQRIVRAAGVIPLTPAELAQVCSQRAFCTLSDTAWHAEHGNAHASCAPERF